MVRTEYSSYYMGSFTCMFTCMRTAEKLVHSLYKGHHGVNKSGKIYDLPSCSMLQQVYSSSESGGGV